ncbi:MAG: hypothetical protein BalsKO_26150 [Balneolaceae bacterium]
MEEVLKKCGHCCAVEGRKRPIGRYIVELHALNFDGEDLELCIACYKHYQRKVARHSIEKEEGFYSNFMKLYKNTFHMEKQNE